MHVRRKCLLPLAAFLLQKAQSSSCNSAKCVQHTPNERTSLKWIDKRASGSVWCRSLAVYVRAYVYCAHASPPARYMWPKRPWNQFVLLNDSLGFLNTRKWKAKKKRIRCCHCNLKPRVLRWLRSLVLRANACVSVCACVFLCVWLSNTPLSVLSLSLASGRHYRV